jgi:hypothetical protein
VAAALEGVDPMASDESVGPGTGAPSSSRMAVVPAGQTTSVRCGRGGPAPSVATPTTSALGLFSPYLSGSPPVRGCASRSTRFSRTPPADSGCRALASSASPVQPVRARAPASTQCETGSCSPPWEVGTQRRSSRSRYESVIGYVDAGALTARYATASWQQRPVSGMCGCANAGRRSRPVGRSESATVGSL